MTTARAGSLSVVLIEGESGIGKSALLREAWNSFKGEGDLTLLGHGVPMVGGEVPLGVMADAIRDLVRREGDQAVRQRAASAADALSSLVPELGGNGETGTRDELLDAFARLVTELSSSSLVWLLVDDVQWADSSSLDVLSYVIRVARTRPVVLMCARRDDQPLQAATARWLGELVRNPAVTRIKLSRLARPVIAEQLAQYVDGPVDEALVDRVEALSQGIPFLIDELMRGGIQTVGPLPESVAGLMLRRLDTLSDLTLRIVQAGS